MIKQAITRELKDYVNITLGLMLYTFAFTVFLLPYEIVTGGIAGIGAVVFYATKFPVQYTFFIINAVLIVAALKILGWRFLMKTIYATFMLTFLLEVAQDVVMQPDGTFHKLLGEGNDFMSLVIGCMMTGTALAIVFQQRLDGRHRHHSRLGQQVPQHIAGPRHPAHRRVHHRQLPVHRHVRPDRAALPEGGVRLLHDVHRVHHARLRDELAEAVRPVPHLL